MVATKPVDFRKGHDGLAALVKNELHKDPFTGRVFVFRSRKADRLKLIYWDGLLDPGSRKTKTGYFWALARDDRPWGGGAPPGVAFTYARSSTSINVTRAVSIRRFVISFHAM